MDTSVRAREAMKLAVRRGLLRANLHIGRDPACRRLTRTLASRDIDCIIDVGANMGQYAAIVRTAGFGGTIHSFEPQPDAFESLRARSASDPAWFSRNLAVGAEPGTLELNIAGNSFSSSVLPMVETHLEAAPESAYVGRISVPTTTIGSFVDETGVDPSRALLKVDTQGFEMPVLEGAGGALNSFAAIQVEMSLVPLYEGQTLFDDLRTFIESAGFELFSLEPGIAAPDGRLLQVDGLFVNRR